MYYCLDDRYALRSWNNRSCCLLDRKTGIITDLEFKDYQALSFLDGITEENAVPSALRSIIRQYTDDGYVKKSPEPVEPVNDWFQIFENRCMPSLYWSITGKCNYHCRHCYLDAPDGCFGECTTTEALNLVDQIADCGIPVVSISGGEPLVRDDFWTIIDALIEKQIIISQIYTNGQLVDEKFLSRLEQRKIRPVLCFSFDGLDWHDWMRGFAGAEEAVINAMKLCRKHGFPFLIDMCVHKGNAADLKRNIDYISQMGAICLKIACVDTTELWKKNAEGNEMNVKELLPYVLEYIPDYYKNHIPMKVTLCPYITLYPEDMSVPYTLNAVKNHPTQQSNEIVLCGAARYECYVSPDMRVIPCMPMASIPYRDIFPSLREAPLKECLHDSSYFDAIDAKVSDLLSKNEKCAACKNNIVCGGGCRAKALLGKDQSIWGCDYDACYIFENGLDEQLKSVADAAVARYRSPKA
ncbi:MAG: radical SAM protein [Clostridia bacterium]|nr:radical SAM protein [Clostridia bacterium]